MQRKANKLPINKQVALLKRIDTFMDGQFNVITGKEKSKKYLFSGREIAAVSGSLLHFSEIHFELKSKINILSRKLVRQL